MPEYVVPPPAPFAIPVTDDAALFAVRRIFCVGRNYEEHAREMGNVPDLEAPFYFTKSVANAVLSGKKVAYAAGTSDYHFEMEFAVALSGPVTREAPMEGVFGYCCALDMTRRDRQQDGKDKRRPWTLGKDVEEGAIFAPLTPKAAFGEIGPQEITLSVNGDARQKARLSDLLHDVPAILRHLSGYYTLGAGDVILTGTPAGVGAVRPHDRLEGRITGLAPLTVTIVPPR